MLVEGPTCTSTPLHPNSMPRHTSARHLHLSFSPSPQRFLITHCNNCAPRLSPYSTILEDGGQDGAVGQFTASRSVLHLCSSTALPDLLLHRIAIVSSLFEHKDFLSRCSATLFLYNNSLFHHLERWRNRPTDCRTWCTTHLHLHCIL